MRKVSKGAATKEQIIESAIDLFYRHGFHRCSFQMIAEKINLTQPALYAYFRNKEQILLAAALKAVFDGQAFIDRYVDEQSAAEAQLKSYVHANLEWASVKRKEANCLLAVYYFGASVPAIQTFHKQINDGGIRRIQTFIVRGNREGAWSVKDPKSCADFVHSCLSGEMIKIFHWPKEPPLVDRQKYTWKMLSAGLTR